MTISSYAQNFEDIILWRALKHVERGFYLDIGAQDPVIESVSLAFYEQGWRGVHVEPVSFYARKLHKERPDEEVIQAAIGTRRGVIPFWEFPNTGLSTGDSAIAEMHKRQSRKCVSVKVPCMRLSQLLGRYSDREIHWLKIDAEGMERSVIQSWRPSNVRPWIVLVESTKPNSPEVSFADWELLLLKLGYEFVYFDGLNRFYVSLGHPELKATFGPGPNVFDDAVLNLVAGGALTKIIKEETAGLQQKLAARTQDVEQSAQVLQVERANIMTLSEGFAKASSAWEQTSANLAAELAAKNAEIAKREERIGRLEGDVAGLNELMVSKEQTSAALAAELAGLNELMVSKEQTSAALDAELAAKNAKIAKREERIGRLEGDVVQLNQHISKLDGLEGDVVQLNQHISKLDAWRKEATVHEANLRRQLKEATVHEANLRRQLAAVYESTSWRVTAPLRFVSRSARWLAAGSWAWITLKPGSRPRRTARRTIVVLAKRRGLVVAGKVLLAPFPAFRERIQTIIRSHRDYELRLVKSVVTVDFDRADDGAGLELPVNQPDLSAEPEGVRRIYRQLSLARKLNLTRM